MIAQVYALTFMQCVNVHTQLGLQRLRIKELIFHQPSSPLPCLDHQAAFIHGHIPAVGNRDVLSDGAGQHGIDHQPIVLGFPELECECTEYAEVASGDEHSHVASTSCREGGPVHLIVSFKDLKI